MRGDDAPTFREAHPHLALASADDARSGGAFELERNAAEVFAEGDDFEAYGLACQVDRRAALAEGFDLVDAVEIFTGTEADSVRRRPEHAREGFDVVGDERFFIERIELCKFGDDGGVVDLHKTECRA